MIEGEEEEEEMLLANGKLPRAAATPLPLSYHYTRIKGGILALAHLAALAIQPSACLPHTCLLVSHALLQARIV